MEFDVDYSVSTLRDFIPFQGYFKLWRDKSGIEGFLGII
jgi:hypothetical protein